MWIRGQTTCRWREKVRRFFSTLTGQHVWVSWYTAVFCSPSCVCILWCQFDLWPPCFMFVHCATSRDLFSVSTVSIAYRPPETKLISNLSTKIVKSLWTKLKSELTDDLKGQFTYKLHLSSPLWPCWCECQCWRAVQVSAFSPPPSAPPWAADSRWSLKLVGGLRSSCVT